MIILIGILIILIILIILLIKSMKSNHEDKNSIIHVPEPIPISSLETKINYQNYYKPRRYLITLNELHFYNVLLEIVKELDLMLFSQVALYNIVETKKELDYKTKGTYFNKIASKSIDFVLVDKNNCSIKLCIELDDDTHLQEKRKKRDEFINQLFDQLEIGLLRYPVYPVYYKETLKKRIQEKIKDRNINFHH